MQRLHSLLTAFILTAAASAPAAESAPYPPLPEAFSSFGAAVCDGHVYVCGGHVSKTHTYSVDSVTAKFRRLNLTDPAKGWEELPAAIGIQGLALVTHGGKLYRIGGMQPRNKAGEPADNVSVADCAVFDPKAGKWEALPELPAGRSSHDAIVVGDRIIVAGGWEMKGRGAVHTWHDTALVMDVGKQPLKWEAVPQPFQRRALNLAAFEGKVYVVGGMNAENEIERSVDVFDPAAKAWSVGPQLPGAKRNGFSPAACSSGRGLYASPTDGKVYRLNAAKDGWQEFAALTQTRTVHRIVPVRDGLLLVLGGAGKAGNIAELETVQDK